MTLHPTQQAVVDHDIGPAAVIAGAGSGKTRTLVERAKRLVESGVNPKRILLLVYNASAREVIVQRLRGHRAAGVDVKTFHGFGQALCCSTCQSWMTGRKLIGTDDGPKTVALAYQTMKAANINVGGWKEWMLIADTSREKLIEPCDVYNFGIKLGIPPELRQKAQDFCEAYEELKERQHLYDFTDQLWQVYLQHRANPSGLPGEYDHLLVDEAQDATPLRWFVADAVGDKAKSYMAVGDLSQAVYGYQGAEPDIFQQRVRTWKTYFLPINWRSGSDIIKIGNRVVKGRPWNLLKETLAPEEAPTGRVQRLSWVTGRSSAPQAVAEDIETRIKAGWSLSNSTAILCRTNAECAEFEVALLLRQISCRTRKSTGSAWENTLGLQMLSYLRLAADPNAYDPAGLWDCVEQIYSHPNRFIRKVDVLADRCEGSDPVVALAGSKVPKVADLGRLLLTLRHLEWPARVGRVVSLLSEDIRARAGGEIDRTDEDKFGLVNVLGQTAKTYGHLDAIYDAIDAVAAAYGQPHVLLSTCHSAKGGEWPLTYLSLDGFAGKGGYPLADPEVRLLYVGVTRAEKELVVTCTREDNAGLQLLGLGGAGGGSGGGTGGGGGGGRSTNSGGGRGVSPTLRVPATRITATDAFVNHMAFEAAEAASLPHDGFPEMMTPHDARVLMNDAAGDKFGPRGDNAIDALDTELHNEWTASERDADEWRGDNDDCNNIPW